VDMATEEEFVSFFLIQRSHLVQAISWATGDRHLAEDVAQETMMIMRRTLGRYERPDLAMYRIGRRLAVRLKSQHASTVPVPSETWADREPSDPTRPPPASTVLEDPDHLTDEVRHALSKLPDRQREVVILTLISGMRFEEIADILGITESAARTHKSRGIARLSDLLAHLRPQTDHTARHTEEGV
jgi:RNA polymerase sigma factor (sigma-70 family)